MSSLSRAAFIDGLAHALEWEGDPLTEATALKGSQHWDSLGRVDAMMYVEEALGLTLDFKLLDQVVTVGDLVALCGDRVS